MPTKPNCLKLSPSSFENLTLSLWLSFRDNILSQGSLKHPMELYKGFRGREPEVEALLKKDKLM